jgi:hypothetical protein
MIDSKTIGIRITEAPGLTERDEVEVQIDETNPLRVLVIRHINSESSKQHQATSNKCDSLRSSPPNGV